MVEFLAINRPYMGPMRFARSWWGTVNRVLLVGFFVEFVDSLSYITGDGNIHISLQMDKVAWQKQTHPLDAVPKKDSGSKLLGELPDWATGRVGRIGWIPK